MIQANWRLVSECDVDFFQLRLLLFHDRCDLTGPRQITENFL
jgi:hypothetical protein